MVMASHTAIAVEEEEEKGGKEEEEEEVKGDVDDVKPRNNPLAPPPPPSLPFSLLLSFSSSSFRAFPLLLPAVLPSLIKCSVFSTAITTGIHSSNNFNVNRIRRHTKHRPIPFPPSLPSSSSPPPSMVRNAVSIDKVMSFSICPSHMPLAASRG